MSPGSKRRPSSRRPAASRYASRPKQASLNQLMVSDRPISSFAILPLRLFLGVTFVYAALQKLLDPSFFRAGSPTYIGAQMLAFSRGSPIQGVLHHLMAYAVPVGVLTVLTEGCIGVLILLGLFTRPAALVGVVLSLSFFLSASWRTYPYFFGSDIVFVVCWLTIAITGPGALALDTVVKTPLVRAIHARSGGGISPLLVSVLTGWHATEESPLLEQNHGATGEVEPMSAQPSRRLLTRGEALVGSLATLGLVALGLHPRINSSAAPTAKLAGGQNGPPPAQAATATPGASAATTTPPQNSAIPSGAKKIGNVSQLPANSAGTVSDPKTGDPAVIVHTSGSNFFAYDAVCTHAGCTVQYDQQQKLLVCPCHGGIFDPAHGAQVVGGPPPTPLTPIEMTIDAHGNIYIV
jgi:thiosulfate dehydrogenase [quinone] large subunit